MGCHRSSCKSRDRQDVRTRIAIALGSFRELGRLHFFYHSPSSNLPVRDVKDEQQQGYKTEPHLEKSAENYCVPCIQKNIVGFLEREERYLFLFTACKSRDPVMEKYRNRRFIVGYLQKDRALWRAGKSNPEGHWAVQGPVHMVSFHDSFPLKDLFRGSNGTYMRFRCLNGSQTRMVLRKLNRGKDILDECIEELGRLKSNVNAGDRL
jgi:hypothetical protein